MKKVIIFNDIYGDKDIKKIILSLLKNNEITIKSRNANSVLLDNDVLIVFKKINSKRINDLFKSKYNLQDKTIITQSLVYESNENFFKILKEKNIKINVIKDFQEVLLYLDKDIKSYKIYSVYNGVILTRIQVSNEIILRKNEYLTLEEARRGLIDWNNDQVKYFKYKLDLLEKDKKKYLEYINNCEKNIENIKLGKYTIK